MKYYIKKYVLIFFGIQILSSLFPILLRYFDPEIFTRQTSVNSSETFGDGYFVSLFRYFLNIFLILFMSIDLKKLKTNNIALLVLTFFSGFSGIILFFILAYNKIKNENRITQLP